MNKWSSALIVLLGAASYGVLATFVKIGYSQGFTVGEITGSQMFLGAVLLWMISLTQYKKWTKISWATFVKLLAVGTFSGLTGVLYYSSLQTIPASIAIILLFQFTWIGVGLQWFIEKKKPNKPQLLSLLFILVGTMMAANITSTGLEALSFIGIGFGLCSALTYAGFIYVSGKVSTDLSPWLRSPIMITGSFIIIFIIFPPTFFYSGVLGEGLLKIALTIAVFGAIIPTICFTYGVPKIGAGLATILSSIELPVAVFMAWVVLSEHVTLFQWVGIFIILTAIAIQKREGKQLTPDVQE